MSEELHDRVSRVESTVQSHSDSIARLDIRQTNLESLINEMRASVDQIGDSIDGVNGGIADIRQDVQAFGQQALRSWPPEAVEAGRNAENRAGRMTLILASLLGAVIAAGASLAALFH